MASDWDFFDKIYCISLLERQDRQQEARAQFASVGLAHKVEFVLVAKHPTDCEQGIYESHLLCMTKGLQAGAEHIAIFEDDILFDRFSPESLKNSVAFLAHDPDWHMLFFGCMVKGSHPTPHRSIIKINYRSLTQAYAIHRRFALFILEHPWQGKPYDDFLRDLKDDHSYAVHPCFAFQSDSPSDNVRYLPLDRLRRILGGLANLQKKNEFYHRHRWYILAAHMLAVLLLALVIK
jgi:GR25 family glycosyltransferase involved in LPS biosynthesis